MNENLNSIKKIVYLNIAVRPYGPLPTESRLISRCLNNKTVNKLDPIVIPQVLAMKSLSPQHETSMRDLF